MSPPIFNPNGPEVSEIVLPNGATASEVIDPDGNVVFEAGPDIPDNDVYLHDDFEDNKLTNREGSGTTTYNGVEGVYRPEWYLDTGTETVTNGQMVVKDGDHFRADINLDLNYNISWIIDVSIPVNGRNDSTNFTLFSQTSTEVTGFWNGYQESYILVCEESDTRVIKLDSSGSPTNIIDTSADVNNGVVTVTRTSGGDWSFEINGTTHGPVNDTTYTNPLYFGVSKRENEAGDTTTVESIKVN